jgi:glycosyltransferase involved in cell wall biosynthesis
LIDQDKEVNHGTSVVFIGGPLPLKEIEGSEGFSMAGYLVTSNIIKGLRAIGVDISLILSFFPMPAWPKTPVLFSRGGVETLEDGTPVTRLGFPNVTPLKQLWLGLAGAFALIRWGFKHRKDAKRVFLCYNLSVPPGCLIWVAARVTHSKMIAIVYDVDLPGVTVPNTIWHRLNFAQTKAVMPHLDGIVGITEWIGRDFAPRVPSICVPGGISDSLIDLFSVENDQEYKHKDLPTVVFAGHLNLSNGIGLLLDALTEAKEINVSLELIGDGPLLTLAKEVSKTDSRVKVRGRLSHDEVLLAYKAADAIISLRLQETLKTPYLFPSKLLEAMAVGKPLICTLPRNAPTTLQCALRKWAIVVDSEQKESVVSALKMLTTGDMIEANCKARMLRAWAIENLSWRNQCLKIKDLIDKV